MLYNGKQQTISKSECVYKRSVSHSSEIKSSSSQSSSLSSPSSSSSLLHRLLLSIEDVESPSGPQLKPEVVSSTLKLEEEDKESSAGECSRTIAVDEETLRSLESEKIINWSNQLRKHYPVKTLTLTENGKRRSGLLESISLLLWGSEAAASLLRRLLFVMLVEVGQVQLRPRWIRHLKRSHALNNLDIEWTILVNSVNATYPSTGDSTVRKASNDLQNSLYVFALANILRRTIIIVDDQKPPPPDSVHESFSGVYLPLLSDSSSCISSPLLLVCRKGRFWPLVEREVDTRDQVGRPFFPVVSGNMEPLLVRFLTQEEEYDPCALLKRYLSVRELTVTTPDKKSIPGILCAALYNDYHGSDDIDKSLRVVPVTHVLEGSGLTSELQLMDSSIHAPSTTSTPLLQTPSFDFRQSTTRLSDAEGPCLTYNDLFSVEDTSRPCAAPNCEYFGRWETDWLCSRCHSQRSRDCGNDNDHLNRTTLSGHSVPQLSPQVNNQISSEHSQRVSMPPIRCSFSGCNNVALAFKECSCHEHLDWLSSEATRHRNPRRSSTDHPRTSQHTFRNQGEARDSRLENVSGFEKNYLDMISQQEKQIEQSAFKCRSLSCFHFGNPQCRGFCHACHKTMASR